MEIGRPILLILAAIAAGAVNSVAGGGTLISFPALVGLGLQPIVSTGIAMSILLALRWLK